MESRTRQTNYTRSPKQISDGPITSFSKEYEFLSNEYSCSINYDDLVFQTAASLFYALKSQDEGEFRKFTRLSPNKARAKSQNLVPNEDYEENKEYYLKVAVKAKFDSNPNLKSQLLRTKNRKLINTVTHRDMWIGVRDGIGDNMLGKVLMELRDEYRKENA